MHAMVPCPSPTHPVCIAHVWHAQASPRQPVHTSGDAVTHMYMHSNALFVDLAIEDIHPIHTGLLEKPLGEHVHTHTNVDTYMYM